METWTLQKEFRFEASHQLPNHDGKCARLHGHSWVGRIEVSGNRLHTDGPKAGMLLDFGDISAALKPLLDAFLDHHHLNETTGLHNPTSEAIARWIYERLEAVLPVTAVHIEETCTSRCAYRKIGHIEILETRSVDD